MNRLVHLCRALSLGLLVVMVLAACGQVATTSSGEAPTSEAHAGEAPTIEVPTAIAEVPTAAAEATAEATAATEATAAAPSGATGGTVKVGSKDFTEEFIVAELYAQLLEDAGFKVEKKLNLGGTPIAQAALINGEIDLYPEYTSTGLLTVLKQPALKDPKEIFSAVKQGYEQQFKLTWLDPAPFNDTDGLAVTKATAEKYGLKTYSDLATKAPDLRLGGPAEFAEREDGIKGLQQAYGGFEFKEFKQLGTGPLRYDALKSGEIDVVVVFTTDARIAADDLVVLEDDKTFYPIYNVAPVIRQDTLAANPQIAEVLNKLAPLLTDAAITKLNAQVDIDGQEPADVARAFLEQQGLLKK